MSTNRDDQIDELDHEKRIQKLKEQARQTAGGRMTAWVSDALSADQKEDFWRRIVEFETAPVRSDAQRLTEARIELPAPDAKDDGALTLKFVGSHPRAGSNARVHHGDRPSQRPRAVRPALAAITAGGESGHPDDPGVWHLDLVRSASDEDVHAWLKYYADEPDRQDWLADFPDYT